MSRSEFIRHLVALLTAVARCDGTIRREEVRAIRSFFERSLTLSGEDTTMVQRVLKEALVTPVDVDAISQWYARHSQPADRLLLLQAVYEVALGDGDLISEEQKLINRICAHLEIGEADHRAIRNLYFDEPTLDDDYAVLGLEPGAAEGDLKRAFRALAARHHPDKVTHLGPDAVAMAGRRFSEIKLAYERIRQGRVV
jgi:DnaJ like chaperone protein